MKRTVLAIVSTKGGVGKTSLATNLAVAAARDHRDVIIVNSDAQRSALYWDAHRRQRPELPSIPVYQWTPDLGDLDVSLDKLPSGWDLAVIDVRGSDGRDLRSALLAANVVLSPTTPSIEDIECLRCETIPLLDKLAASIPSKQLTARIIINQWQWSYNLHKITINALKTLNAEYHVCQSMLRRLADYQSARAAGMGVMEYDPSSKAAKEFAALYAELKPILK